MLEMLVDALREYRLETQSGDVNVGGGGRFFGIEGVDAKLPRKTSRARLLGIRTVNRHR